MNHYAVAVHYSNKMVTPFETIDAIKKSGFKQVFIQWYNKEWDPSQKEQLDYVRKCNLQVIFAHLGYQGINHLWLDDEIGEGLVERYKQDIQLLSTYQIPMVVMHLTSKTEAPIYNEIGLRRLKEICACAKEHHMQVAFENTKIKGYLEYVMANIHDEHVGICFDSGHYHAHFQDELDFQLFDHRILAVHLHDNNQLEDQHLLPFDGTLDWKKTMINLKNSHYQGPLTLEVCYRNDYLTMSVDEFYQKAYEAAAKLEKMMDDVMI